MRQGRPAVDFVSVIGAASLILALSYLVATAAFQFAPLSRRYGNLDRLGLLPRWQFFVRAGERIDLGVEVRDRLADGTVGEWTPQIFLPERRFWHCVWYPQQYRTGVSLWAIETLFRRWSKRGDVELGSSLAYAVILSDCRRMPRAPDVRARQFALVRPDGDAGGRRWTLFISAFHTC